MACKCEGKPLEPNALRRIVDTAGRWAQDATLTETQRELAQDLAVAANASLRLGSNSVAEHDDLIRDLCCYLSGVVAHRRGGHGPCTVGSPCDQ